MTIIFRGGGYEQLRNLLKQEKTWKVINFFILIIINLMCLGLTLYENFWYDEAYTIGMIRRDFSDIIHITSQDVHPPLYYILLKIFYIFPGMEQLLSVKIFSWIFYLLYLILGAYICREHYNRRVECFWLVLSGFMAPMIVQSTSPRMYTIAIFFVSLALYLAFLAIKNNRVYYWIGFAVCSAICMWLHTFCMLEVFVLYIFLILWAMLKKKSNMLKKILLCGVSVSVAYVPWLISLWRQFSRWAGWESGWSSHMEEFGLESIKFWVAEWMSTIEEPSLVVVVMCTIVFVIAGCFAIGYMYKTRDYIPCIGIGIAGIVVMVSIIISITIVPCFAGRYIFPMFGGVFLFVAVGLEHMKNWWMKIICVLVIIGCGLFTYQGEIKLEDPKGLKEYCDFIDENYGDNDLIMADSYYLMMMSIYYPQNEYKIYGNVPVCMPYEDCEAFTEWEQVEKYDVIWYLSLENFRVGNLDEKYEILDSKKIKFYYYDIVIDKYKKRE